MILLSWSPHNRTSFVANIGFYLPHVSSTFSLYLFNWLYVTNTLVKYSEIFFYLSICNFSKTPRSFCKCTFLTLLALDLILVTSHTCLTVVVLATILKVASSKHRWMIMSACWSFLYVFCTTFFWAKGNVASSIGSSKSFSTVSHIFLESIQAFTWIHQVSQLSFVNLGYWSRKFGFVMSNNQT